jgi:exonuclease VII large subunit
MEEHILLHPDIANAFDAIRKEFNDAYERLRRDFAQSLNVPQEQLRAQAKETDTALHTLQLSLHKRIDDLHQRLDTQAHAAKKNHAELTDQVEQIQIDLNAILTNTYDVLFSRVEELRAQVDALEDLRNAQ